MHGKMSCSRLSSMCALSCLALLIQQTQLDWSTKTAFRLAIARLFNIGAWPRAVALAHCQPCTSRLKMPCPSNSACMSVKQLCGCMPNFCAQMCSFKGICCAEHEQHKHVCRVAARVEALVTRLQAIYRGACQRRAYLQDRQHVLRLQAAFRAFPARMQFLQAKGAAIWIQSCWRRHQAQQHVLRTRVCSVSLVLRFST